MAAYDGSRTGAGATLSNLTSSCLPFHCCEDTMTTAAGLLDARHGGEHVGRQAGVGLE